MSRDTKIKDIEIKRTAYNPELSEKEIEGLAKINTEGCIPKTRDYIRLYADEPCLEACQKLYDLNIETYTSGGHVDGKENETAIAFIGVIYDSLSEENKGIVSSLVERGIIPPITDRGEEKALSIQVPIHSDDLVGDVSDKLLAIASEFQQQDVLYGRYTYEQLRNIYFRKLDTGLYEDGITLEEIPEEEIDDRLKGYQEVGYIPCFSEDGDLFFITEDLLNKHSEFIKNNRVVIS